MAHDAITTIPSSPEINGPDEHHPPAEGSPALLCPHCGGTTLMRQSVLQGRQRYRCKDCRATSYGRPAFTSPPPPPCPRCGERTRRGGPTGIGTPTYRCTACNHRFILPPPPIPKRLPNGRRALCHHCDSDDLVYNGVIGARQRYKCRSCQKATYGFKPRPVKPLPCPYCRAQCKRRGRSEHKRQRYLCTACKRYNIALFPSPRRPTGGPYRWRRSFCLDIAAAAAIEKYCNTHVMTMSQAIRAIFHEAADHAYAVPTEARRQYHSDRGGTRARLNAPPIPEPPIALPRRLPDLRAEAARFRMSRDAEIRHLPSVYVVCEVTICLDDKAYTGLLRTMHRFEMNHQQAARYLVSETNRPKPVAIAILGRAAFRDRSQGNRGEI